MTCDPLLSLLRDVLVNAQNRTDGRASIHITVLVGGFLVSGRVISQREFELGNPPLDSITEYAEQFARKRRIVQQSTGEDTTRNATEFLHLAGARFFIPGQPPIPNNNDGVCWRCRLSDVIGFHIGRLEQR